MKRVLLIHSDPKTKCREILKNTIVEVKELEVFKIGKDALIQNLPVGIMNSFLYFFSVLRFGVPRNNA